MELDRDHIHQLMNEKVVMGVINETDEQLLQNAFKEYPELKTEFEQLQQEYAIWSKKPAIQQLNSEAAFAEIEDKLKHKTRRKRNGLAFSMLLVAASIAAFVIYIYPLFTNHPDKIKPNQDLTVNKKTLQLQLSNGEIIDLSAPKDSITLNGGTQLKNTNNSLTYSAKDNANASEQVNNLWVPPGMDYHITLSDGTIVFLNSATTLRFPFHFAGNTREITIDGEAYLQVAKDHNRPFILHTPKGALQVLGTAFNVNTYDSGRVKVSLVEGAVSFATADKQTLLKPGQALTYQENKGTTLTALNENELLWIQGRYKLDNTPMAEITKVLPRWYGVQVVIDNPATAEKRFTGTILKAEPIQEFLDAIKLTTGADSYYKEGVLHIR